MRDYDDMIKNLPGAYRQDPWINALINAVMIEDEGMRAAALENVAQLFLDSLTFNISIEEKLAGLNPKDGATLEERRSALSAKWRSATGKCDIDMIQRVCDAWDKGEVEVEYDGHTLNLKFTNTYGIPDALDDLLEAVREVCPAHIPISYTIKYRLWKDIKSMTWGELSKSTWADVKGGELNNGRNYKLQITKAFGK